MIALPAPPPTPEAPWRLADMFVLYLSTAIGLAIVLVAWWGVSGTTNVSHQVPWINLGVIGVIILGTGNCFWLMIARRAIGDRRGRLLAGFEVAPAEAVHEPIVFAPTELVFAEGMAHFHRPDCQLVQDKATTGLPLATHDRDGRKPCGMCEP